jgi:hypothetical protein
MLLAALHPSAIESAINYHQLLVGLHGEQL